MAPPFNHRPGSQSKPGRPDRPQSSRAGAQSANASKPAEPRPVAPEKQLAIPDVAAADPASFELLRVWVARQSQQITLRPGIWQDPTAWGIMLADLARSIVKIHEENDEDLDTEAFLASVLEGFDTEIESVLEEFGDTGEAEHEAG
jgi:ABC-type Zn uptake system ZnuABC Zn-binding protein ZnuA